MAISTASAFNQSLASSTSALTTRYCAVTIFGLSSPCCEPRSEEHTSELQSRGTLHDALPISVVSENWETGAPKRRVGFREVVIDLLRTALRNDGDIHGERLQPRPREFHVGADDAILRGDDIRIEQSLLRA